MSRTALALALVLAACLAVAGSGHARNGHASGGRVVLRLDRTATAFGLTGSQLAWTGKRVVVADLETGKRTRVANDRSELEAPVGVAGKTVLWLQQVGGNLVHDKLLAAAPGRQRRFGSWGDDDWYLGSGRRLGGIAADGRHLAYATYELTQTERRDDRCYERGICHWRVTGGGTFLVQPGSLARRRILPPAKAVAVDGATVAAAILRPGARYNPRRAQIVLADLADGTRRAFGEPLPVSELFLSGDTLAAVSFRRTGRPVLHAWSIKTRRPMRTLRLPGTTRPGHLTLSGPRLVLTGGAAILAIDLRTGEQRVVAGSSFVKSGPWVWRGRVIWAEEHSRDKGPYTLIRAALLPG